MTIIHPSRRKVLAAGAAVAGSVALPFSVRAQSPMVVKLSHVVAEQTPKGQASAKFKEVVEKAIKQSIPLPETLEKFIKGKKETIPVSNDYADFKEKLEDLLRASRV